jgi:hypothetical protein
LIWNCRRRGIAAGAGGVLHLCIHKRIKFFFVQKSPVFMFGAYQVPGKGVNGQLSRIAGYGYYMLYAYHVHPDCIGGTVPFSTEIVFKAVDKGKVQFFQEYIAPVILLFDIVAHVPVQGTVFGVCPMRPVVSHLPGKLPVVLFKQG